MQHSNCVAEDFLHPRFFQLCKLIEQTPTWTETMPNGIAGLLKRRFSSP